MMDPRVAAIRPVVAQDPIVCLVGEGDRVLGVDGNVGGCGTPVQSLVGDVVDHGSILGFDGGGPGEVAA